MRQTGWDERATYRDLHAVMTTRWTLAECAEVDRLQRAALAEALPGLEGAVALDLGCGIGRLTTWLARDAAFAVGADHCEAMVARARREASAGNVSFVRTLAESVPFRDGAFDVVLTAAVLQHLVAEDRFGLGCAEAARVLRPGGVLVCCEGVALDGGEARPTTMTRTVRRPLERYAEAFGASMALEERATLRCLEDEYTVMRWIRTKEAFG